MLLKFLLNKNVMIRGVIGLVIILTVWWMSLNPFSVDQNLEYSKYIWGLFYQVIALWGGISGIVIARSFGGFKSVMGKSILFFSTGLLFQCIGQSVYSYFNLFSDIQAPYPSLGDVGYFGSVILYIFGAIYLAKASGVKISLKSSLNKTNAILIPLIILGASYSIFLQDYTFYSHNILKILLDFGYPLGQAFYVSIAILTLVLSQKMLGGMMKKPILFFLISLIVQYISDFTFLYQANNGTWHVGGVGDFFYMISYFLMTVSIIQTAYTLKSIKES